MFHLLSGVAFRHVLLGLEPLHTVRRIEGDQIQLHRVFQRLVDVGVLPLDGAGGDRLQLGQIEGLQMLDLESRQSIIKRILQGKVQLWKKEKLQ